MISEKKPWTIQGRERKEKKSRYVKKYYRRRGQSNYKDKQFLRLLYIYKGNLAMVAEAMGVHHTSVCGRINRNPIFKERLDTIRERLLDKSEQKLLKAAHKKEDLQAIIFHLKSKGKHRGYGDELRVGNTPGQKFHISVTEREKVDKLKGLGKDELMKLLEISKKINSPVIPSERVTCQN